MDHSDSDGLCCAKSTIVQMRWRRSSCGLCLPPIVLLQGRDDERTTGSLCSSIVWPLCFQRARRRSSHVITRTHAPEPQFSDCHPSFYCHAVPVTLFLLSCSACACFPPFSTILCGATNTNGHVFNFALAGTSRIRACNIWWCYVFTGECCRFRVSPRQFYSVGHSWSIYLNEPMYETSSIYFKWHSSYSPISKRICQYLYLQAKWLLYSKQIHYSEVDRREYCPKKRCQRQCHQIFPEILFAHLMYAFSTGFFRCLLQTAERQDDWLLLVERDWVCFTPPFLLGSAPCSHSMCVLSISALHIAFQISNQAGNFQPARQRL